MCENQNIKSKHQKWNPKLSVTHFKGVYFWDMLWKCTSWPHLMCFHLVLDLWIIVVSMKLPNSQSLCYKWMQVLWHFKFELLFLKPFFKETCEMEEHWLWCWANIWWYKEKSFWLILYHEVVFKELISYLKPRLQSFMTHNFVSKW